MYRFYFTKGVLSKFLQNVQDRLNLSSESLAKLVGVSGRTLRNWKQERYTPDNKTIESLSRVSGVQIPKHQILDKYWYKKLGAGSGGKRRFDKHGALGDAESRSKGGKHSWLRRKKDVSVALKYTKNMALPEESNRLAEFAGIILGKGIITQSQCYINLHNFKFRGYAQYLKDLMQKLFDTKVCVYKVTNVNMVRITISGVNIVKYLQSRGLTSGHKAHSQLRVPGWIAKNSGYIKSSIRGLMDTKGRFITQKYTINENEFSYARVVFSHSSKHVVDFMNNGLTGLGFHPRKTVNNEVWLDKQNEVRMFYKKIGSRISLKSL